METIAEMLVNDKAGNVYVDGTLSQTPVYFKAKVILGVTVNASVL